jgi:creatinine amidohydrolase
MSAGALGGGRRIDRMTSPAFAAALAGCDTVILPLASIEQGGGHCPLGADLMAAETAAEAIAEKAGCLVAPTVPYGDALDLDIAPGTISVESQVFAAYVESVARSLLRQGFRNIVFLCCHSLNLRAIDALCRRLRSEGFGVASIDWWKAVGEAARGKTDSALPFGHCGEVITSACLATAPDCVDLGAAEDEEPLPYLGFAAAHPLGSAFVAYGHFRDYCRTGSWGEASRASAEKGRAWIAGAVESAARFILDMRAAKPPF